MKMKRMKALWRTLAGMAALATASCGDSIDCPINNIVYSTYGFYAIVDGVETSVSVLDTLTITAQGTDSILINLETDASEVEIPVSYTAATDTLVFHLTDTLQNTRCDTIWIDKENYPHYESPDCPASIFHTVTDVRWTTVLIDSVTVVNPNINYNVSENFKVYFRSDN